MVSIPSGRGFWAGSSAFQVPTWTQYVSIPSGRGFWAGPLFLSFIFSGDSRLNPLWSGLLGRPYVEDGPQACLMSVSIPSGRGFWAG